jgi:adenine-specific DNA-methyltransferase
MEDRLDLTSPDLVNENFEKLAALFPNCVTESAEGKAIDFDLLKQELNHAVVEGSKERYRLEWPGKREAIVTANLPTNKTLRPVREESVNFDNTENIYIEGDNLEVLKLLQESYLGKIKMIYIDPPYNTGKDFVYKDNLYKDAAAELFESGQKDEYSQRLVANPDSSGRFHSDWLTMMYPRLKLARNLLTDDGIIFISIDNNEVDNLRKICDEIFGESNSLLSFIWELPRGINAGFISKAHEFIVTYSKNISKLKLFFKDNPETSIERCNKKVDSRHPESSIVFPAGIEYEGEDKVLIGTIGGAEPVRIEEKLVFKNGRLFEPATIYAGWTMKGMIQDWLNGKEVFDLKGQKITRFFFKENGKLYSEKIMEFDSPKSILKGLGDSQNARKELYNLFGSEDIFDYPKPIDLIKQLASFILSSNDIILDFFSGSAVTADAIFQLNSKDKGSRRFILVQIPEATNEKGEAYKAGYKNICDIGKERIRRAAKQIIDTQVILINLKKSELEKLTHGKLAIEGDLKVEVLSAEIDKLQSALNDLDTGFRVYRLDSSNMQDVYYKPQEYDQKALDLFADNVKPERTADDLLAQVMLDWGLPLSLKIEQVSIAGKKVFKVAENSLYACFDIGIDEEFARAIANDAPLRIVFRDNGFKDDTAKVNVKQLLKQLSPETEMKVI